MATMHAAVFERKNKISFREVPKPTPGPGEADIRSVPLRQPVAVRHGGGGYEALVGGASATQSTVARPSTCSFRTLRQTWRGSRLA